MGVSSFVELYLSYYAWGFYNVIWEIFVAFGFIYIPFGYHLFEAFTEARKRGKGVEVAERTLHALKIKILVGMSILVLAAIPAYSLSLSEIKYSERSCAVGSATPIMTTGDSSTSTTYQSSFTMVSSGLDPQIPVWWNAVLSIAQALSDAVKVKIPCTTSLTDIRYDINMNKITDPVVRQEIGNFFNSCYRKAVAKFQRENPSGYTDVMIEANDIGWIGSEFFRTQSGYYDTLRPDNPVTGFAYSSSRDRDMDNHSSLAEPAYGKPYCNDWYDSLRTKIVNTIEPSLWTSLQSRLASFSAFGGSTADAENTLIRSLTEVSDTDVAPSFMDQLTGNVANNYSVFNNRDTASWLMSAASGGIANVGTYIENISHYPKMYLLKTALPIVHAFVLFGLVLFTPFLLLFSQYGVKELLTLSVLFVSVKFWPAIWAIGQWFDDTLTTALMPGAEAVTLSMLYVTDDVINYTISAWYVVGPILFSLVTGLAGYSAGIQMDNAVKNTMSTGERAGNKGGNEAENQGRKNIG